MYCTTCHQDSKKCGRASAPGCPYAKGAKRQRIERRIVTAVIDKLLAVQPDNFELAINNGGDEFEVDYTRNRSELLKHIMLTDDEYLHVRRNYVPFGWVRLIYGNDGWDVVADNTSNLEPFIGAIE